jgi:hypothetical protein
VNCVGIAIWAEFFNFFKIFGTLFFEIFDNLELKIFSSIQNW